MSHLSSNGQAVVRVTFGQQSKVMTRDLMSACQGEFFCLIETATDKTYKGCLEGMTSLSSPGDTGANADITVLCLYQAS